MLIESFSFSHHCVWWSQCTFKPGSPTSHSNIQYIWSPVNLMQVFRRLELQPPQMCLRCAKCYSWAQLSLPAGLGRTWHSARKALVEKKAISFLFNVKSCGFVVLSADIKAFPLPHYPISPLNPTPYWPPTGVSPLNLLSHPPIHPWFEVFLPPVCQLETSFLLPSRQGRSRPR